MQFYNKIKNTYLFYPKKKMNIALGVIIAVYLANCAHKYE